MRKVAVQACIFPHPHVQWGGSSRPDSFTAPENRPASSSSVGGQVPPWWFEKTLTDVECTAVFISPSPTSRTFEAPGFTSPGRPGLLYSMHSTRSTWWVGGRANGRMVAGRGVGRVDGWVVCGWMMVDGWVVERWMDEDGRTDGWGGADR